MDLDEREEETGMSEERVELDERERKWINLNIKQRIPNCTILRKDFGPDYDGPCDLCESLAAEHADTLYDLHVGTAPCDTFGTLQFKGDDTDHEFIRLDVDMDMNLVRHLFLKIWRVPTPDWIISLIEDFEKEALMDDSGNDESTEENEGDKLEENCIEHVQETLLDFLNTTSQNAAIWVTTEGWPVGLSPRVGRAILKTKNINLVPISIYPWGLNESLKEIKQHELIDRGSLEKFGPDSYSKYVLFTDDGNYADVSCIRSCLYFRIRMEKAFAQMDHEQVSIPYVTILFGGWSNIIHGVKKAIDENVPVIVVKRSGGFADVLTAIFEESETNSVKMGNWTSTVIDEHLRNMVRDEITKTLGEQYLEGERIVLECLPKRELITIFDYKEKGSTLQSSVFEALFKSKTRAEKFRIVDEFMPEPILPDKVRTPDAENKMRAFEDEERKGVLQKLFRQLLKMDEAETIEFILNYNGYELVEVLNIEEEQNDDELILRKVIDEAEDVSKAFGHLFKWSTMNMKEKCAALFWKKGENLLKSALTASKELYKKSEDLKREREDPKRESGDPKRESGDLKGGSKETKKFKEIQDYEKQGSLFTKRAVGLTTICYERDPDKTLKLVANQLSPTTDVPDIISNEKIREIFGTDAFMKYFDDLWNGCTPDSDKDKKSRGCLQRANTPMMKYLLNLVSYTIFLCLFGHTLLFQLESKFSILEAILVVWWVSFVVEEIRQVLDRIPRMKHNGDSKVNPKERDAVNYAWEIVFRPVYIHFSDSYWNILDLFCHCCFLIGGILLTVYHVNNERTDVYETARVFLSLDLMFYTWRILQHLAILNIMAPDLEMIYQMMKDLFPFLVIMFVFIMSQGLATHALLYPNRDWSAEAFINIPKNAFWNVFGELGLDEIEASETQDECSSNPQLFRNDTKNECPSTVGRYTAPFFLAAYMLMMNVLLLNLLIAKFSNAVDDTMKKTASSPQPYQEFTSPTKDMDTKTSAANKRETKKANKKKAIEDIQKRVRRIECDLEKLTELVPAITRLTELTEKRSSHTSNVE